MVQCRTNSKLSWPCKKVKVKTTGLVILIILANCWNHNQRSMSNGSPSYGVHNVTHFHGKMWENSVFCDLAKRSRKGQDQNNRSCAQLHHIIPVNCWNHDRRSMSNGSMSYGVHKVTPVHGTIWVNSSVLWPCKKVKVKTTGLVHNFIILAKLLY